MNQYPEVIFPSATEVSGPSEVGYGVISYILQGTTYHDYTSYLTVLKENGYEEIPCDKRYEGSTTYVSVFRKGDSFVSLRHSYDKKTWIAFYEEPEYHSWNAMDAFKGVPNVEPAVAKHSGDGNYVVCMENRSKEDYLEYLSLLENHGYEKQSDNGAGLGECVFTTTYTKNNQVLTIVYLKKTEKLYITAGLNQSLSSHLQYEEETLDGKIDGKQTTLAMLKMIRLGSSFVIQLKNGHYIVNDGGLGCELEALLTYLEENAPSGEIPVIEAWVISHAHPDHSAVIVMIAENPEYAKRIRVGGIYYTVPSEDKQALHPASIQYQILGMRDGAKLMQTEIYRMYTGQRLYFCDITLDILLATEQVPMEVHSSDFNDTSTWCLYTIEGQTVMIAGDADHGASQIFSEIYEKDYWKFDIFTAFHHGSNTDDFVTEHCQFETILVPRAEQPFKHVEENARLKAKSKEWFIKGEGTRVLRFPYHVGESKVLKEFDCIAYHEVDAQA